MEKSKIYTKKGDEGLTSLVGGKRVSKAAIRVDAYGTVDELNSFIACLIETIDEQEDRMFLLHIQSKLFDLGGYLASEAGMMGCSISDEEIKQVEAFIDKINTSLPPLKRFILPGGCPGNAWANVCRTVCRRAERRMVKINESSKLDTNVLKYINRLSDYFFLLSRKQNFIKNIDEICV